VDEATRTALHHSQVIDLTTTGRRTGQQRQIEIFLHDENGLLFITGMPRADQDRRTGSTASGTHPAWSFARSNLSSPTFRRPRGDHRPGTPAAHRGGG
jgi:hypothetical protein